MQNHLGQHKHGIQKECGIAKIVTPDGGNTVRDRDNRGDPQPCLCIHGDSQRQDQQSHKVTASPKKVLGNRLRLFQTIVFFLIAVVFFYAGITDKVPAPVLLLLPILSQTFLNLPPCLSC